MAQLKPSSWVAPSHGLDQPLVSSIPAKLLSRRQSPALTRMLRGPELVAEVDAVLGVLDVLLPLSSVVPDEILAGAEVIERDAVLETRSGGAF